MPELPDLEVFSINLKKMILNKTISSAIVHFTTKLNVLPEAFASGVVAAHVADIIRIGKELFFHLSNGNLFSVHLMHNGEFKLVTVDQVDDIPKKILSIAFEDNSALVIVDYLRQCKITLNPTITNTPDALSPQFDYAYFSGAAKRYARMNVKTFLVDQKIFKGVGNAYADEILWKANISPGSVVGKIPKEALQELYAAIGYMLKDAIENILRLSPDRISGEERSFLRIHNSKRKIAEDGEPILVKDIASNRAYYTKKQRLFF